MKNVHGFFSALKTKTLGFNRFGHVICYHEPRFAVNTPPPAFSYAEFDVGGISERILDFDGRLCLKRPRKIRPSEVVPAVFQAPPRMSEEVSPRVRLEIYLLVLFLSSSVCDRCDAGTICFGMPREAHDQ